MDIITICGSLKFKKEIIEMAIKMELEGNCVLTPIFPVGDNKDVYTKEQLEMLGKMHKEKIRLANAIYVVNVDNYIGESTQSEIKFAKSLKKKIMYYSDK